MAKREVEILTEHHREVLDLLFSEETFKQTFYLTGGTALAAFYLQHRHSDDLDFFTHSEDIAFLQPLLQQLQNQGALVIQTRTPDYVRALYKNELKVDFVKDVPFRLGLPHSEGIWKIDSIENITINKISAILGRLDIKDYVDLYFLIKDDPTRIIPLLNQARQKDGSIEPFIWSRVIGDVESFTQMPRMIIDVQLDSIVKFYQKLQATILSSIKPS